MDLENIVKQENNELVLFSTKASQACIYFTQTYSVWN